MIWKFQPQNGMADEEMDAEAKAELAELHSRLDAIIERKKQQEQNEREKLREYIKIAFHSRSLLGFLFACLEVCVYLVDKKLSKAFS